MPISKLKEYLDDHGVWYECLKHDKAFTAPEVAASAHIPGRELAKTVIVKLDGRLVMTVLPASEQIDFDLLQEETGALDLELAREEDFLGVFPDCEVGAMPPFGNIYGVDVYVADTLALDELIAFNACSHTELIRLAFADFERLVQPEILRMSVQLS